MERPAETAGGAPAGGKSLNPFDSDTSDASDASDADSGSGVVVGEDEDDRGPVGDADEDLDAWTHVYKVDGDARAQRVGAREQEDELLKSVGSDDELLQGSILLFGTFGVMQMVAAIASSSLALLSDSVSMIVDTMSYALNLYAERRKRKGKLSAMDLVRLEVFVPLFSAGCLTLVLIAVCWTAAASLAHAPPPHGKTVREGWPLVFASANLVIDAICAWKFLRRTRGDPLDFVTARAQAPRAQNSSPRNVNMCSAWTHIIADTLRSLTVLFASLLASLHPQWNPNRVDGIAALVVSAIIFVVTIPLLLSAWRKYGALLDGWRDALHADCAEESASMLT